MPRAQQHLSKYIHMFEDCTAALIFVDLSCFNVQSETDQSGGGTVRVNKWKEQLEFVQGVGQSRYLSHDAIIVVFTKADNLNDKVRDDSVWGQLTDMFPEKRQELIG